MQRQVSGNVVDDHLNFFAEKSISELFTSPEFEGVSREVKCYVS